MTYPYPELIPLLKINTTPEEYMSLVRALNAENSRWQIYGYSPELSVTWADKLRNMYLEYKELLPEYVYARCPFCGQATMDKFDTYTLRDYYFLKGHLVREGMHEIPYQPSCEHYLGTHHMINLHGAQSFEFELFSSNNFLNASGEVPYMMVLANSRVKPPPADQSA